MVLIFKFNARSCENLTALDNEELKLNKNYKLDADNCSTIIDRITEHMHNSSHFI